MPETECIASTDTDMTMGETDSSTLQQEIPLSVRQIEDLFALVDWKFVMLDPQFDQAQGPYHPVAMFRALVLPYLIKIPSERALVGVLEENKELARICLFSERSTPTRSHTWRFRHIPFGFYPRIMQKLLISLVVCNTSPNYALPFVSYKDPNLPLPKEGRRWQETIDRFPKVEICTPQQRPVVTVGKTIIELNRETRVHAPKQGLSSELLLPVEIRIQMPDGYPLRFSIDRPFWLKTSVNRRMYGTDTITIVNSVGDRNQTYAVCNALVILNGGGRKRVLLSKRLSGFGKGHYALPGGKQRENETLEDCLKRELREETGLSANHSRPISFFKMKHLGRPQVFSIGALVDQFDGRVSRREPEQNTEWEWYDLENLPFPLFETAERTLEDYRARRFVRLTWKDLEAEVTVGGLGPRIKQLALDI